MQLEEVHVQALPQERLSALIGPARRQRLRQGCSKPPADSSGRAVVNVNSTATGGGVAEMLRTLLAQARGGRYRHAMVRRQGRPRFLRDHQTHPQPPLRSSRRRRAARRQRARALRGDPAPERRGDWPAFVRPRRRRARSTTRRRRVWRPTSRVSEPPSCGAATSVPTPRTTTWSERGPSCAPTSATSTPTCSRGRRSRPLGRTPSGSFVIPPSIDPFAPKNQEMEPDEVEGGAALRRAPRRRRPSAPHRVHPRRRVTWAGQPARRRAPDRPSPTGRRPPRRAGVPMGPYEGHGRRDDCVRRPCRRDQRGSSPARRTGGDRRRRRSGRRSRTLEECDAAWRDLSHGQRTRIHLACLPMRDPDENAIIVNAIQRHAAVVTQKSIAEGFGLTVAEAMWKSRPIVASARRRHRRPDHLRRGRAPRRQPSGPGRIRAGRPTPARRPAVRRGAGRQCTHASAGGVPRRPPSRAVGPTVREARQGTQLVNHPPARHVAGLDLLLWRALARCSC